MPIPPPALARDAITRTKTRTGAIAFNRLTNILPNTVTNSAFGTHNPRQIPIIRPIRIRAMRGVLV